MTAIPHPTTAARSPSVQPGDSSIDAIARQPGDESVGGHFHAGRIPGLDGLRGLAIIAVMLLHFGYATDLNAELHTGVSSIPFRLFHLGWIGVDLFFVLSGFLITGILIDTRDKPRFFRDFYARRTLRIFPLYYGVLLLVLVVAPALSLLPWPTDSVWLWTYTYNIPATFRTLGMHVSMQGADPNRFIPFWSLAVEEQFYFAWPLVVYFASRRNLKWIALGGLLLSILTRAVLLYAVKEHEDVQYLTIGRLDGLCCGALVALGVRSAGGIARTARLACLAAVACVPVMLAVVICRRFLDAEADEKNFKFTLVAVGFAAFLALTLKSGDRGVLGRWVGNPVLRFFGKYSYGLYIYHYLLMPQFIEWFGPAKLTDHVPAVAADLLFILIAGAATIVISLISFHAFEAPILTLKRYFTNR